MHRESGGETFFEPWAPEWLGQRGLGQMHEEDVVGED